MRIILWGWNSLAIFEVGSIQTLLRFATNSARDAQENEGEDVHFTLPAVTKENSRCHCRVPLDNALYLSHGSIRIYALVQNTVVSAGCRR
jgi:hypothetical protein